MQADPNCIFCKIAAGTIPSQAIYRDETLYAFPDINPKAPVHLLIIPKAHVLRSAADMEPEHQELLGSMVLLAKRLAKEQGIAAAGYRLVLNVRQHGGQEVDHLHLHLLGGRPLGPLS